MEHTHQYETLTPSLEHPHKYWIIRKS